MDNGTIQQWSLALAEVLRANLFNFKHDVKLKTNLCNLWSKYVYEFDTF